MADRPSIPNDLKRAVLVEAGHRCAIPTCREPTVDIHHIIPWERQKEHRIENLIALCPNCHRRADRREIDAKSLRLYKKQLQMGHVPPRPTPEVSGTPIESRWTLQQIVEKSPQPIPYDVDLAFPRFHPDKGELGELNLSQRAEMLGRLHAFRSFLLGDPPPADAWWASMAHALAATYDVAFFDDQFISIRYKFYHYGAGAAHGQHWVHPSNYRRAPLITLTRGDLLDDGPDLWRALTGYCVPILKRELGEESEDKWVAEGAGPNPRNYAVFTIAEGGLVFTFGEYQVGPYAAGIHDVYVPKHVLLPFVRQRSGLLASWG